MSRMCTLVIAILAIFGVGSASASKLDDELDRRLKGAWAVVDVEIWSSCSGTYSDNTIGAAGVASKAARRFEPGELVKIDKIKVKRTRVDLLTTLAVPVLAPRHDGPFELWDERECKAQLIIEVGRSTIKRGDADEILASLTAAMTPYGSLDSAQNSDGWNGRERRPYPDDYDRTLARYEVWRAEQTNAAVAAGIDRSIAEAASAAEDIEDDAEYLAGFAAGAEEMQEVSLGDCGQLIDASFSTWKESPPSDKSRTWKNGYADGQRLVFHARVARDLHACFVPVPPGPIP